MLSELEIKNAIIKNTYLSIEDHGVLSGWLHLDYGTMVQGFGGCALYLPKSFKHHRIGSFAGHWIFRVLEIAGVTKWGDLPGKAIRVKATTGKITEIGHIVNDNWFNPESDFVSWVEKEGFLDEQA
jgi:hypothetical protein